MKNFTSLILSIALAVVLVTAAGAQQLINPQGLAPSDINRTNYFSIPNVQKVPLTVIGGTGQIINNANIKSGHATGTFSIPGTVTPAVQPESPRELVIFQSEAAGATLSVLYTIKYRRAYDFADTSATIRLSSTTNYTFPIPVTYVKEVGAYVTNGATNDKIKIGYRGFFIPGSYITNANQIGLEAINGVAVTTAGTVPATGFYLPNSISAGQTLAIGVRTTVDTPLIYEQFGLGTNTQVNLGTH